MREREEENETKCPLSTDKTPKKLTQKVSINKKRTAYFKLLGSEKKKKKRGGGHPHENEVLKNNGPTSHHRPLKAASPIAVP